MSFICRKHLLQTYYSYQLDLAQEKSVLDIKEKILTNIQNENLNQFRKHNISYYYQRFTSDADECRFLFNERNITIVCNFVFLILLLLIMFKMSWELTLIIVILTIIFLIVKNKIIPIIERKQKASIESDENLNAFFEEYVDEQETIRNFSKFSIFKNRFTEKQRGVFKAYKEHTWIDTIFDIVLMTSILNAADILINWIGGYHIILGKLSIGMLTAYPIYFYRMWDIANAVMALPKQTVKAMVSLNRINEILNQESSHELTGSPTVLPSLKVIRLDDIGYVIDGKTIFSHFSGYISYEKGKIIGITGENGSGKSTLARLINKSIIPT